MKNTMALFSTIVFALCTSIYCQEGEHIKKQKIDNQVHAKVNPLLVQSQKVVLDLLIKKRMPFDMLRLVPDEMQWPLLMQVLDYWQTFEHKEQSICLELLKANRIATYQEKLAVIIKAFLQPSWLQPQRQQFITALITCYESHDQSTKNTDNQTHLLFLIFLLKVAGLPAIDKILLFEYAICNNQSLIIDAYYLLGYFKEAKWRKSAINYIAVHGSCQMLKQIIVYEISKLENDAIVIFKEILSSSMVNDMGQKISLLLSMGASLECRDDFNYTPLLLAIENDNYEAVKVCLNNDANALYQDINSNITPMSLALTMAQPFIAFELIAFLKNFYSHAYKSKLTQLTIPLAIIEEDFETLNSYSTEQLLESYRESNLLIDIIMLTAKFGKINVLVYLMDKGLNPFIPDEHYGRNALHYACEFGQIEMVKFLLKLRKTMNVATDPLACATEYNEMPLHKAALKGYTQICQLLLEHGAQVNAQTHTGDTALHFACFNEQIELIKILLNFGADSSIYNKQVGERRSTLPFSLIKKEDILAMALSIKK